MEKAHRDVLDLFYQVFDRGMMRDGEGREIDFRHCVILMTSNLGSTQIDDATSGNPTISQAELLDAIRDQSPGFFRLLRADVCALYLSDAGVWHRIGFPGPSSASGGYPDFDQPQAPGPR